MSAFTNFIPGGKNPFYKRLLIMVKITVEYITYLSPDCMRNIFVKLREMQGQIGLQSIKRVSYLKINKEEAMKIKFYK